MRSQERDSGAFEGFPARLEKAMKGKELTNRGLASAVGVQEGTVRGWRGGAVPGADHVVLIAQTCGVSVQWLLTGEEFAYPPLPEATKFTLRETAAQPLRAQESGPMIDVDLLRTILAAVDDELARRGESRSAQKRAKAAAVLYEYFTDRVVDDAAFRRFLDAVLES